MDFLLLTIAFLTIFISGLGCLLLILPCGHNLNVVELSSLSLLFGTAFVSLTSFFLGFFLSGIVLRLVVTAACIVLGAIGTKVYRRGGINISWSFPSVRSVLLLIILIVQTGIVVWLALHLRLGWDGLLVWEIKARLAYLNNGVIPISYFSDPTRQWTHPEYPLLLPLTEAYLYSWLDRCDQGLVKLVFPLFYVIALMLLYVGGSRIGGQRWRGFLSAFLLFFVPLTIIGDGSVSSGYADFPIAVFYLASVMYLMEYVKTGSKGGLYISGCLSALLPWVKQEGLVLWLCLATITTIKVLQRREMKLLLFLLLLGVLLFGGWRVFLGIIEVPIGRDFLPFDLMTLWSNLDRGEVIVKAAVKEMMNWRHWSLLWMGMLLALPFLFMTNSRRKQPVVLLLTVIIPIILYLGTYLFSAWSPFIGHINCSLSRLLLQVSLVALLIIGLAIPIPITGFTTNPKNH